MRKIIIHHHGDLGLGGTQKMCKIMMKYFVEDKTFNHVVAFNALKQRDRESQFEKILGKNKLIPYSSFPEFIYILDKLQPFVLHHYGAGIAEFPMIKNVKDRLKNTKFVQTSVFGNKNDQIELDAEIFVSKHVQHLVGRFGKNIHLVRNAVEKSYTHENLRKELNIEEDVFVFGNIQRPDNNTFLDTCIRAYKKIENEKTMFLWLPKCDIVEKSFIDNNVKNYMLLPKTVDDVYISMFYNTIDVLAHSRRDGECNSDALWSAQAHGKPIISTYGYPFNGHVETIGNSGFVTLPDDVETYSEIMMSLMNGNIDYNKLSCNGKKMWEYHANDEVQANKQLKIYKGFL